MIENCDIPPKITPKEKITSTDKFKIEYQIDKENLVIEVSLRQREQKDSASIYIGIKRENSIPSTYYHKEFYLDDLQVLSEYFNMFQSIEKAYKDFKLKSERKDYEISLENIPNEIIIKIKTYTIYENIDLTIPIEEIDQEKVVKNLCDVIKKHEDKINELENQNAEKVKSLEERLKILEDKNKELIQSLNDFKKSYEKDNLLFNESKIIKTKKERQLLQSFIRANDSSKKDIHPLLIYRATDDGDTSNDFHKKCDMMGATLTIVESENGRRFGGYTSVSWDKSGNYTTSGYNFLFSLDTRKYYTNSTGYYTYHYSSYGPTFGQYGNQDLCIASGCLNNNNSYNNQTYYNMESSYELSLSQTFKVKDYEVFQI